MASRPAAEIDDRESLIRTIHGLVDTLVQSAERTGKALNRGEAVRLVSVARVVAGWSNDAEMQEWSRHVARATGQH